MSFFLLTRWAEKLQMRARKKFFERLEKMGREDTKLLERVFSYFTKKLRTEKPDDKLLVMLLLVNFQSHSISKWFKLGGLDVCIIPVNYSSILKLYMCLETCMHPIAQ